MSSATVILPLERSRYFVDRDGYLSTSKREDEKTTLVLDWTDQLASGESVSSVAYVDSGVTSSGAALTSPNSTIVVTGVGEVEVTATLSTGRILQRVVRFYDSAGARAMDYR
jgi:hypothetical protein